MSGVFVSEVPKNPICLSSEQQAGSSVLLVQLDGVEYRGFSPCVPSGARRAMEGLRTAKSWQFLTPLLVVEPYGAAPGRRVLTATQWFPFRATSQSFTC